MLCIDDCRVCDLLSARDQSRLPYVSVSLFLYDAILFCRQSVDSFNILLLKMMILHFGSILPDLKFNYLNIISNWLHLFIGQNILLHLVL